MVLLSKYKDYIGRASMDSDSTQAGNRIPGILKDRGVDVGRYEGIGLSIHYYARQFHYYIICVDHTQGGKENPHLVRIELFEDLTNDNVDYIIDLFSAYSATNTFLFVRLSHSSSRS